MNKLEKTIAKLELKQLEVIDKLSKKTNDYIIRCIAKPDSLELVAVNGDWEKVTGYKEENCVGKSWGDFLSENDDTFIKLLKENNDYNSFTCDINKKNGETVEIEWKSKYHPEINSILSIGRSKKSKTIKTRRKRGYKNVI